MHFQPSEPHHHHHLHALTNGAGRAAVGVAAIGTILAVAAIPTFVVGPFIVSAFKPEWSYGRRLATSMAFSAIVGTATGLIRASKGDEKAAPAAPAAPAATPAKENPALDKSTLQTAALVAVPVYFGFRALAPALATTATWAATAGTAVGAAWYLNKRKSAEKAAVTAPASAPAAVAQANGTPVPASRAATRDVSAVEVASVRLISPQAVMPMTIDQRARALAWQTNCAPWYPSLPMR
jgi:hypothetical protein